MRVAIIPARGGSRRIPRKNIRHFFGRPIISYSINAARASGLFDYVYVSTEDREIAEVARLFGSIPILRDGALAVDDVGTQAVMADALRDISNEDFVIDEACCIYATAPMITEAELHYGWVRLKGNPYTYVPGIYYWGAAQAFLTNVPLERGLEVAFARERYIDINTEEDWLRAEQMYAALHKEAA
jgi:pseudaminic acid cytidylyltransferase